MSNTTPTLFKPFVHKLICALLLGIAVLLAILEQDPLVQQLMGAQLQTMFANAGDCVVRGQVARLNLFAPYIVLKDVYVQPRVGADWQWHADHVTIALSWWSLLWYGCADLFVTMHHMHATSDIHNNKIALMDHIRALSLGSSAIPLFLQKIDFNQTILELNHSKDMKFKVAFNSSSRRVGRLFKHALWCTDGALTSARGVLTEHLQGHVTVDSYQTDGGTAVSCLCDATADLVGLPADQRRCSITGSWERNEGWLMCANKQNTVTLNPVITNSGQPEMTLNAQLPLEYCLKNIMGSTLDGALHNLTGVCDLQATVALASDKRGALQGILRVGQVAYKGASGTMAGTIAFERTSEQWHGTIAATLSNNGALAGSWQWHELTNKGDITFNNQDSMQWNGVPAWSIQPQGLRCVGKSTGQGYTVDATVAATNTVTSEQKLLTATATGDGTAFSCTGKLHDNRYTIAGTVQPARCTTCTVADAAGKKLIDLHSLPHDARRVVGTVEVPCVRQLVLATLGYDLQGEGTFDVRMLCDDTLTAQLHLSQGTIRLPHTYNFISGFDVIVDIDPSNKKVLIEGLRCALHRGMLTCDQAVVQFDALNNLAFAHAPLLLRHCLLNFHKDLFAVVSGHVVMQAQAGSMPRCTSKVIIEQAQLKENILSDVFQKDLVRFASTALVTSDTTDMACDITIKTQEPIRVKTAFLETQAKLDMAINGTVRSPEVSGKLELIGGSLFFPYKPLSITRGTLYFLPQQLNDPLVELVAKNKIKKYNVTMHIAGSLANPNIMLDASPLLTEEQIVALLLVGSHQESLNMMMPALIMNNISQLVFGKDQSPIHRAFKTLLQPFKYIHLVPSFSDHTGRGGLRGAVEIQVNDRWRALLQKNFSLSEDTRVELEYLVSDDISLRALRDERRDLGAEVEMRWKF